MPLIINALGGGHTDTHTHIPTREQKRFLEIRRCGLRPCAPSLKTIYALLHIS